MDTGMMAVLGLLALLTLVILTASSVYIGSAGKKKYLLIILLFCSFGLVLTIKFNDSIRDRINEIPKYFERQRGIEQIIVGWEREELFRGNNHNAKILTVNEKTLREFAGRAFDKDDVGLANIDLQKREDLPRGFPPGGILRSRDRKLEFWFQAGYPPSRLGGPFKSLPVFIMRINDDKFNFYTCPLEP